MDYELNKAFGGVKPDQNAKNRMLRRIMKRAPEQKRDRLNSFVMKSAAPLIAASLVLAIATGGAMYYLKGDGMSPASGNAGDVIASLDGTIHFAKEPVLPEGSAMTTLRFEGRDIRHLCITSPNDYIIFRGGETDCVEIAYCDKYADDYTEEWEGFEEFDGHLASLGFEDKEDYLNFAQDRNAYHEREPSVIYVTVPKDKPLEWVAIITDEIAVVENCPYIKSFYSMSGYITGWTGLVPECDPALWLLNTDFGGVDIVRDGYTHINNCNADKDGIEINGSFEGSGYISVKDCDPVELRVLGEFVASGKIELYCTGFGEGDTREREVESEITETTTITVNAPTAVPIVGGFANVNYTASEFEDGIRIETDGADAIACGDGEVVGVSKDGADFTKVVIKLDNGYEAAYHYYGDGEPTVGEGDRVTEGQKLMGISGTMLFFLKDADGNVVSPAIYFPTE